MARIKDESKQAVIAAADMIDVVSGRTQLRKVGSRYTGRCPFHEERTPSFSVNPVDKLFYCFGCSKGGDVITFVRETEQLDFAEALEWLAERFRVPLEYEESSPQVEEARKRRDRLHAALDQAAAFYERHLWETAAGEPVRSYLESRGLREPICREFRLGLSPGDGLARKAQQKGFTIAELHAAGLANARGRDYFPRRLMFPIADARGRIVGFQARKLHEDDPLRGKYVNSPEGELFHKSAVLYGLNLARTAIAREERAIVVEGNTDVIALRQAGLEPVVASMGTALTEQQLKELSRLTRQLLLCFDSDAAGEAATLRGMELAVGQGFDVRVVTLPPGLDPADAAEGFEQRLGQADAYPLYRSKLIVDDQTDRQLAYREAKALLDPLTDSPQRQEAWRYVNDKLGMTVQLQSGVSTMRGAPVSRRVIDAGGRLERMFLAACLLDPEATRTYAVGLRDEHFDVPEHRTLRRFLAEGGGEGESAPVRAELWATAETEGITSDQAKGFCLEIEKRFVEREIGRLQQADMSREDQERHTELIRLQSKLNDAVAELA